MRGSSRLEHAGPDRRDSRQAAALYTSARVPLGRCVRCAATRSRAGLGKRPDHVTATMPSRNELRAIPPDKPGEIRARETVRPPSHSSAPRFTRRLHWR